MTEDQVKQIIEASIGERSSSALKEIVIAGLDSTVLLVLLIFLFIYLFRSNLAGLLKGRNIEIRWGDKQIKLNDLSNNIDQEIDPLREDVEALKYVTKQLQEKAGLRLEKEVSQGEEELDQIKKRFYEALRSPKFRWRTIDRLALFSRTTPDKILELISADENIVMSYDTHGKRLAKLKHR